jgi:GDP-D-mannose dehydratase
MLQIAPASSGLDRKGHMGLTVRELYPPNQDSATSAGWPMLGSTGQGLFPQSPTSEALRIVAATGRQQRAKWFFVLPPMSLVMRYKVSPQEGPVEPSPLGRSIEPNQRIGSDFFESRCNPMSSAIHQSRRVLIVGSWSPLAIYLSKDLLANCAEVHVAGAVPSESLTAGQPGSHVWPDWLVANAEFHAADIECGHSFGKLLAEVEPHEIYWLNAPPEALDVASVQEEWASQYIRQASAILETFCAFCKQHSAKAKLINVIQNWPARRSLGPAIIGRFKHRTTASNISGAQTLVQAAGKGYRVRHGVWISHAVLGLSESPIDELPGTMRKIVRAAVRARVGFPVSLCLGDPDEAGDWGFAGDFANAIRMLAQQENPEDVQVSSGNIRTVRDLLDCVFGRFGLHWQDYFELDPAKGLPTVVADQRRDRTRLVQSIGYLPTTSLDELLTMLIQVEEQIVATEVLKTHGVTADLGREATDDSHAAESASQSASRWLSEAFAPVGGDCGTDGSGRGSDARPAVSHGFPVRLHKTA